MSYESEESRNWQGPVLVLVVLALSAVSAFFLMRGGGSEPASGGGAGTPSTVAAGQKPPGIEDPGPEPPGNPMPPNSDIPGSQSVPETAEEILENLGVGVKTIDPAELVTQIGRTLEAGDVPAAAKLIGRKALNKEQLSRLRTMAGEAQIKLRSERPVSEIGELEINRRARWALNLDDDLGSRIYFDLQRDLQGRWEVEKMLLPPEVKPGAESIAQVDVADALGITDAFLQAALRQDFETAKSYADTSKISDAKIAGLCIVFEEGQYHLRAKKPLRASFHRETTAAFLAYVEAKDGTEAAQFGLIVERADQQHPWRVSEINLDTLLADYADRVAGGDVYFTPLMRNPEGGETLILYFGFDEDGLTARTERQLEIVALLLQTDGEKKLRLSGHTDALGSEHYNKGLSRKRAEAVRDFLVASGVDPRQIVTEALGKSKPRRPNQTESGEDDPTGRRANRRTEIYLDF